MNYREIDRMNMQKIVKEAGVNLKVLGNVKGSKWLDAQAEPKPAMTSKEFRDASEPTAAREAECKKFLSYYQQQTVRVSDIVNAVKEIGGTVAPAQVKKWLGVEDAPKAAKTKPEPAFTAALTGGEQGGRYFSKAQVYLFEAVMSMMQESDIEEAKRLVQQKLVEEKQAEIMAKAKAEFEAMNLDSWADSLLNSTMGGSESV